MALSERAVRLDPSQLYMVAAVSPAGLFLMEINIRQRVLFKEWLPAPLIGFNQRTPGNLTKSVSDVCTTALCSMAMAACAAASSSVQSSHFDPFRVLPERFRAIDGGGKLAASVALTSQGRGLPQLPQCGAPTSLGRILFFRPQLGHTRIDSGPVGFAAPGCRSA